MSYLRQNINFGLFLLIIAILIAFVGFTSYYYNTFINMSSNYEEKLEKISELASTLTTHKVELNKTSAQLKVKAERELELSEQYINLKAVKEQLDLDKAALETELYNTKSELEQKKAELVVKTEKVATLEITIVEREATISSLRFDIDALENQIDTLNNQICTLQGTC